MMLSMTIIPVVMNIVASVIVIILISWFLPLYVVFRCYSFITESSIIYALCYCILYF